MGQDRPAGPGADDKVGRDFGPGAIGALGDIHGAFDAAREIIRRHPGIAIWLCVGDIADQQGRYEPLGAPVYWIHGNNDNFDAIASGDLPADLRHIPNGTAVDLPIAGSKDPACNAGSAADVGRVFRPAGLRVAGLGGTFAPTWYETAAADLPRGRSSPQARGSQASGGTPRAPKDDKRRHFVREEVDACKAIRDVDIFMSHEAPKPFRPFPGGRGPDAGKAQINEVLAAMKPRLHLFGHHHRESEQIVDGVRSIGLDLVSRSYALINTGNLGVELLKY